MAENENCGWLSGIKCAHPSALLQGRPYLVCESVKMLHGGCQRGLPEAQPFTLTQQKEK